MHAPEFWSAGGIGAKILSGLLAPLGAVYGYSVRFRQWRTRPFRASARVLCVGNLTAGGTGKTPVAVALARMLMARGARVAFLSRGYGGRLKGPVQVDPARHSAADTGDEPLLLAGTAPTVIARDRSAGARLCDAMGAEIIVMDDGHQNFRLAKDLALVVVSGKEGFGNGRILPAGPLREPIGQGLARADAVIVMGEGHPQIPFNGPILRARAVAKSPESLRGVPVFAFAGIADPERFFDLAVATGANLLGRRAFADHHPFTAREIAGLRQEADKLGAKLVTTEKDFVRLDPTSRDGIAPVAITAGFEDEAGIAALLDRLFAPRNKTAA